MPRLIDLTGKKFGYWEVIERCPPPVNVKKKQNPYWKCRCICGVIGIIEGHSLRKLNTTSCGCMRIPSTIHGHARRGNLSKTYFSWRGMLDRCINKSNPKYIYYGGKGIRICDRWMSFKNFLEDMGERPLDHTLDRIDSNGDYTLDNCRWATWPEQCDNRATYGSYIKNGVCVNA
jgi:hypothetical protein